MSLNRVHRHLCRSCDAPLTCVCGNPREVVTDGKEFRVWCVECGRIKDGLRDAEDETEIVRKVE